MSNLRDAAQQALEALMDDCLVKVGPHSWERRSDLAIIALRAALAEPEKCPPDMCLHCVALQERLDTLTSAVLRSNGIS